MTGPATLFERELPDFFAAIGAVHKQLLAWQPMMESADVNAPAIADTSRAAQNIEGLYFDKEAKPLIPNGFDPRTDQRPGTQSVTPRFEFLPGKDGSVPDVRHLDVLTSAQSGARWRVLSVFAKKTGVLVCPVNAL